MEDSLGSMEVISLIIKAKLSKRLFEFFKLIRVSHSGAL